MTATAAAAYDLTPRLIPFLDRHMVLPLLDFLQSTSMYSPLSLIQARVDFASTTKMVDLYQSEYHALHEGKDPPGLDARFEAVYAELRELQAAVGDLLQLMQDEVNAETGEVVRAAPAMSMREEGRWTVEALAEQGVGVESIDALYRFAKLNFEIGRYREAADYLFYYRELMKGREEEKSYWALWGKLAGEVLMANMDTAWADLQQLHTLLESKFHLDQLEQLQQRTWIIHWSLFVFFNTPNGHNLLIDFLMQDKLLNTIQMNCPHILRYLTAAAILHKRRKNVLKDLVRVLLQSTHDVLPAPPASDAHPQPSSVLSYTDPLISFLLSLYTDFSFSAAHAHLQQARILLSHDYFLAGAAEREILENARVMLFETYCAIHSRVEIGRLQREVDLTKEVRVDKDGEIIIESEEEEKKRAAAAQAEGGAAAIAAASGMSGDDSVLVSLLRACHVNGRIDSYHGHLLMLGDVPSVYQQVIDRTKSAAYRSAQLAQQLQKRYKAKKDAQGAVVAAED